MKCKFCDAELEEGVTLCSACGEENGQPEEREAAPLSAELTEETAWQEGFTAEENAPMETEETAAPETPIRQPNTLTWQLVVGIAAAVVLLGALAVVLLYGMGVDLFPNKETTPAGDPANTSSVGDTGYTGTDEEAVAAANAVVATMNGKELTNSKLQLYYNLQVTDFLNNNYSYLSYMGLDYTQPLSTQQYYYDETKTWEEYFIDVAIKTWQNYQTVYMLAEEADYQLPDDMQAALDKLPGDLEEMAKEQGFESADALIKENLGASCTLDDYTEYYTLYYTGASFTNITPTDAEVETYFNENIEYFEENGITKESGPIVDVRHILVSPEGGTTDENEKTTYSEAEWAACLTKAQAILDEWKAGEATEDSFAALANTYSVDGGSNTNGGLYTGITSETNFVEPFLNWCIADERQPGDTDIVQSDFGYHIMYFSYSEQQWIYYATTQYISDYITGKIEEGIARWPIEINYDNIVLADMNLA